MQAQKTPLAGEDSELPSTLGNAQSSEITLHVHKRKFGYAFPTVAGEFRHDVPTAARGAHNDIRATRGTEEHGVAVPAYWSQAYIKVGRCVRVDQCESTKFVYVQFHL
jgi:hypothetical protein